MKRVITIILAMAMALSICSVAYAENGESNKPSVTYPANSPDPNNFVITAMADNRVFQENAGSVNMTINIENKSKDYDVILAAIQPSGGCIISASGNDTIPKNSTKAVNITATLASSGNAAGTLTLIFNVPYGDSSNPSYGLVTAVCNDFSIVRAPSATEAPKKEDSEFRIRTSSVDSNGVCVLTPSGDYGDQLEVRLPLTCTNGYVYDLKVTPVLSNDIEKFPFDIDLVDYTLSYPGSIGRGQVVEFLYHLRLSKKATVGVKQVDFNVTYRNDEGDLKSGTVSLFVNVRKGLSPTSDKDTTTSVPKLIIESYKLSSDKIYAGETFDLEFTIKNTSDSTNLQNVQIHIKDAGETATIVPASGGSNTLYISKIGKGQSSSQKVSLQTAPDATAKAYTLNVDFSYESASTNAAHTANETIAVPILQKIRLKCDEPTVYDDVSYLDSSTSMSIKMYNMGRSSIYNCIVDVEGNGLKLEESYFGGTLSAGSTLAADISVIPSEAGDIQGTVVISYEDVYGEPGEERLPFTLHVEDPNAGMENMEGMEGMGGEGMEGGMTDPGMEGGSKGFPWWGWVIGAGALGGGGFFGFKKLKKRRARSLEDDV
ncbi:MAG: COG1361 S-layer family protein [Christensenellales bacterium]